MDLDDWLRARGIVCWGGRKETLLWLPLVIKRELYKCGQNYLRVTDVDNWPSCARYFCLPRTRGTTVSVGSYFFVDDPLANKVALYCGDITRFEIDAIVNAASRELDGDYGVDRAIHAAAGDDLVRESRLLAPCEIGDAKITGGYKLPAKYVIHTVGPIGEHPMALAKCYRQCMNVLVANKLRTIAFPCIATGTRRYPAKAASEVAVREIKAWLATGENAQLVDLIIFCVNGQSTAYFYKNALCNNF